MTIHPEELRDVLAGQGLTQAERDRAVDAVRQYNAQTRPEDVLFQALGGRAGETIEPSTAPSHSQPMTDPPSKAEMEAHIAASEARTETKFAELRGDMRAGFAQIHGEFTALRTELGGLRGEFTATLGGLGTELRDIRAGQRATQAIVVGSAIAAVAVIVATLAFGATWFGLGINASDIAHAAADRAIREFVSKAPLNH